MKKTNKLLSVLLTLALFASLLPFAALPARADSAPTGGYCGDADNNNGEYVAWQLVGGTLTVTVTSSVEGSMKNYLAEDSTAPWYASRTGITSVVIGSGVKTIGDYAFQGCTGVTSVVIPDSVTSIGKGAFSGCTALKYVFFPNTDTKLSIGENAFSGCAAGLKFYGDKSQSLGGITLQSCVTPATWSSLQTAVDSQNGAAYIKLDQDFTRGAGDAALTVSAGKTILLDLNGHTINGGGSGSVLTVSGSLTLADCDRSFGSFGGGKATGKITGGSAISGGGVYVEGGTFTMTGGTVSGNTANTNGGGVYVSGTFTMTGGTVSGNETGEGGSGGGVYVDRSATFTMLGGTVSDNKAHANEFCGGQGGGVYVGINGTFTMSGSSAVSRNEATSAGYNSADGGGVYVESGATFTMSGSATVSDNKAENGGGVCVKNGGAFDMSGGTVSGNETGEDGNGGGVCVDGSGSTFTMTGGTVSGNTAVNNRSYGGGVYVIGATFTMSGGTVSDNEAGFGGGGVCVDGAFTMYGGTVSGNTAEIGGGVFVISGTFRVSGAPVVRNNNGNNVKLNKVQRITVTVAAPLTDGAALWIYAAENDIVATGDGYTLTAADAEKFRSDDGFYAGKLDENQVRMVLRPALSDVSVSGGTLTATVAAQAGSTLIAASYDENDRLTGVATTTFSEKKTGTVEVSALPANAACYRVFLVDGSYAPLCPAAAFTPGT